MKKFIALTALSTVLACGAAEAKFDGLSLGGSLMWNITTSRQNIGGDVTKFNYNGPAAMLDLKYGKTHCNLYMAADARLGYDFSSKKRDDIKLRNGLRLGLGGRIGTFINPKSAIFFRMGVDMYQQRMTYTSGGNVQKDTFKGWEFAPGVGFDRQISKKMHMGFMYEYAFTYSTTGANGEQHSYSQKPRNHRISLGVSYSL